jgi:signal transduction histidine kinase
MMIRRLVAIAALFLAAAGALAQQSDISARIEAARGQLMANPAAALRDAEALHAEMAAKPASPDQTYGLAMADWLKAASLISLNRPHEALLTLRTALPAARKALPDSAVYGELVTAHGNASLFTGKVQDALRDYQDAFEIFRRARSPRGQAVALQHIAAMYFEAGDFENARRYGQNSIEVYSGDPMLVLSAYNNAGNASIQLGRYREAEAAYLHALDAARTMGSPLLQTRILQNLARAQTDAGEYGMAEKTLTRGYAIAGSGPAAIWRPALDGVAAMVALRRKNLDRAATLIDRAFAGAKGAQASMPMRDFHRTAYDIFRARGEPEKALDHLEAFKKLDDEQRALTASASAALMAANFDFANQNVKIGQAQASAANARARLFILLLAGTALVLVLLLIGILSIRRSRNQVRAANATLSTTNEDLARALAAKTEFLATTSHEIRTPLNGILGMTQVILADKTTTPAVRSRIELVHGAGETMRALVDDILDVAKMETGELRIHPAEMNLTRLLEEAAAVWADQAETRKIGLVLDIDEAPPAIVADEVRLRQVVFNLMSNAIKFTDRGRVCLAARAVEQADGSERLVIEVVDSGVGIPPDRLEEIFESFRQVDGGVTRRHGGTGLGLTICRSLAHAMGGDISVASTFGVGSTFTIELPLVRAQLPATETVSERGDVVSLALADLLLIEANPLSQGILRALLGPKVRQLHVTAEVDEGLRIIASGAIDHVVADGATLGLDRIVAARLAEVAGAQRTHLSILWPTPDADIVNEFETRGVQLIAKPIAPPELLNALEMIYRTEATSHDIAA